MVKIEINVPDIGTGGLDRFVTRRTVGIAAAVTAACGLWTAWTAATSVGDALAYVDALILLTAALLLWVLRPDDEPVVDYEDGLRTMSSYHGARYDDGHDDQYQPPRYEVEQPTYDYPEPTVPEPTPPTPAPILRRGRYDDLLGGDD
ncbi:hypothetical protein AWC04_03835 [Mycolicibacterium fallax]|uniref:Uncharacterized protein n=1 Tax=Mycolicibacterium fallax TaxID=1793 RepID=A0A1X1RJ12_MYCFA|nr:hypothetical protein AWC04_03835 [Mycolicibacterium fallax]BBY99468.1 hypothetical protein MFAL_29350 [Mycolicibacterium fallax]